MNAQGFEPWITCLRDRGLDRLATRPWCPAFCQRLFSGDLLLDSIIHKVYAGRQANRLQLRKSLASKSLVQDKRKATWLSSRLPEFRPTILDESGLGVKLPHERVLLGVIDAQISHGIA